MYYLNMFQYLLNLLQSFLYPLYGIKASKGYPSLPCITSQHRVSPYKKEKESIPYYHMNLLFPSAGGADCAGEEPKPATL